MPYVDGLVKSKLKEEHENLSQELNSDVIFYSGPMALETPHLFQDAINALKNKRQTISIVLRTGGGAVEPVERAVEIIRRNYRYVNFIIPDYAMSAGTIFCMAGDKIYMSQLSSLGPIDPQVQRVDGSLVPAMGYLEQFYKFVEKSKSGQISPAELDLLRRLDLGDLNRYEQARNLTITLLKKWLVNYKFKYWKIHKSSSDKKGQPVTEKEKNARAEEIAAKLGDISIWHSHGRHICINTLKKELKLKIEDYSNKQKLHGRISAYDELAVDYIFKNDYFLYVHAGEEIIALRRP